MVIRLYILNCSSQSGDIASLKIPLLVVIKNVTKKLRVGCYKGRDIDFIQQPNLDCWSVHARKGLYCGLFSCIASYPGCSGEALTDKAIHPSLSSPLPPLYFPLQTKNTSSSRRRHFLEKRSFNKNSGWTSTKIAGLVIVLTASIFTFLFLAMSFATVGLRYCKYCSCLKYIWNGSNNEESSRIIETLEEGNSSWTKESVATNN